jgi:hypothetical protein
VNTTTKSEQNALTLPERAAVALGSSKTEVDLRELVKQSVDIVTVNNAAGRDQAHRIGMNLKNARVAIEKTGKAAREDATAFSKAVIAEEKRLVNIIDGEEERVFALRDSWDAKIEAERQAKIDVEIARTKAIADAIAGIRERETDVVRKCKTAADTQVEIDGLEAYQITETVFQERYDDAVNAKEVTLQVMRQVLTSRIDDERAAAEAKAAAEVEVQRLADERAELAKLRAEQAERDRLAKAEADRVAAEQALEAARLRAEAAAQTAEVDRQRKEAEAALRAQGEAQEALARKEQAECDRVAAEVKAQLEEQAAKVAADRRQLEEERAVEAKAKQDAADAEATRVAAEAEKQAERDELAKTASYPTAERLLLCVASEFQVGRIEALSWLRAADFEALEA